MKENIEKLANVSLATLWDLVSKPWKIPIIYNRPPPSLSNIEAIIFLFPDLTLASAESCRLEFLKNNIFFEEINKIMVERRHRRTNCAGLYEFLYMAIRFAKPQLVFETGVFDGQSSAVILQALNDNGKGILVSVDLPAIETIKCSTHCMRETALPTNCQPGWVIPDYLRERHSLVLGDSKELLPQLFKKYPKIDTFFHDSLHTFEHQYFEYTTAWPHLSKRGLLLSDDIFWSAAFHRFCKEKGKTYVHLGGFGAVRK